ncbi:MAG: TRAP transporter small permease subunit [Dehalococcoidia bacterium]|nr:TRAP transporter small permease subunit [Dehalococcoidia bacterium]
MQNNESVKSGNGILSWIDRVISWIGEASGFLVLPLMMVIVVEVFARYGFHSPTIWAWEMSRFFGGAMFVLALGYIYLRDQHVRVDILYSRWSVRTRAIINVIMVLLIVLPVLIPSLEKMFDTAALSWATKEVSSDSAWRVPIYPFKAIMPFAMTLLLVSVLVKWVRDIRILIKGEPHA